jgi:non-homologous end joining protein Ku
VPRNEIDPVYFDSSYYLHPDGPIAVEALRVIADPDGTGSEKSASPPRMSRGRLVPCERQL